jgi:hypothetical protein
MGESDYKYYNIKIEFLSYAKKYRINIYKNFEFLYVCTLLYITNYFLKKQKLK